MDLKRILVAVNTPNGHDAAFERALAIAQSSGAELYVLHAVPANQPYSSHGAERLKRMTELRTRAEDAGVNVRTVEQHGDPAAVIELHADARTADLIVLGMEAGGRSPITERIIRRTNVPTLIVASNATGSAGAFRNVLAAVDLSPASRNVLDAALAVTSKGSSQLTVMHAVTGIEAADAVQSPGRWKVPEYRTHIVEDARRNLEEMVSVASATVDTRVEVTTGSAPRAILEHAAESNADLVVVGRSRGFKLLGSTALRVLRRNDRSLLVMPSAGRHLEQKRAA